MMQDSKPCPAFFASSDPTPEQNSAGAKVKKYGRWMKTSLVSTGTRATLEHTVAYIKGILSII